MKIFATIASLLLIILSLAGCGGGSSSAPAATTIVSGIASKGPIINGVVKIFSVLNDAKGPLLVQTTTDATGNYKADIGAYTGPIMVEASGSYLDEATGLTKTIPADSPLHAALPLAQGNLNLPVTALTELAFTKVGSSLNATTISAANTLISDLFKVDITTTLPVAPTTEALATATQAQKDYTLALATVSQLASAATGTSDSDKLNNALSTLGQGITSDGMTTETADSIRSALDDFVSNTNNETGVSDTSSTSLVNAGTFSKTYKLSLQGNFTPGAVTGLQFNLTIPSGVTLSVNNLNLAVLTSSLALSGNAPSGALLTGKYAANTLTVGLISTSALTGELITLTCNIPAGVTAPGAAAFTVSNLKSIDKNTATVMGVSVAVN